MTRRQRRQLDPPAVKERIGLFYQVPTPCNALVCARFLLELVEDDRPLDEVRAAAAAIKYFYREQRIYLDEQPIDAAIEVAEAQLAPGRVLQ